MNHETVDARLQVALEALEVNDGFLLEHAVGERCIAAKLAVYLGGVFPSHDVDVEYNKHGVDPKVLDVDLPDGTQLKDQLVIPDVVVHRRGSDNHNVLVIEMKKNGSSEEAVRYDRAKLRAFKGHLGYQFGALIQIDTGRGRTGEPEIEWM